MRHALRLKPVVSLCLLLFPVLMAQAQVNDSTDYFPPPPSQGSSPVSGMMRSAKHLLFIDVTQNTWLGLPEGLKTRFISGGLNLTLFYDVPLVKNILSVSPGLSFSNATVKNNGYPYYYYDNNMHPDSTGFIILDDSIDAKSKIAVSYLDIPVEFPIRIHPRERGKNFWIAPGFRAGIRISDFWKYKGEDALGNDIKFKQYNLAGISSFHYGVSLRAGYYKFGVFVFYSLNDLFDEGEGPSLTPLSAGITFTPF